MSVVQSLTGIQDAVNRICSLGLVINKKKVLKIMLIWGLNYFFVYKREDFFGLNISFKKGM